ncbi:MAG TPA: adenylate/guanylate cyclase domain-containing protein [Chryseosolibacter sp.]|nr:adenylate/guanylate cyclase domain-containing protein [Chryseosolibacter sp.]
MNVASSHPLSTTHQIENAWPPAWNPMALMKSVRDKFGACVTEENRIFLFIDLNDSTMHAEELGHLRYSKFLSRFFQDFKICVRKMGGNIYQYVGDEIVVSWENTSENVRSALLLAECFRNKLASKFSVYRSLFGFIPDFKVALHSGFVAITRMGFRKMYHGDVLNTCSRMIKVASERKLSLVVSPDVLRGLNDSMAVESTIIENVIMRGKRDRMQLLSVRSLNY